MNRIEVMIVDDSAVLRQALSEVLKSDPGIDVLCAVSDPLLAMERMKVRWPQVIVLDIEMPRMDGLTFLRKLMHERPTPVVICSTLTEAGAATTLEALASGAVSVVTKPKLGLRRFIEDSSVDLISAVKAAAAANVHKLRPRKDQPRTVAPKLSADAVLPPQGPHAMQRTTERIVTLGTSTGGTQALEHVLTRLPSDSPGIAVVQHMPEKFTAAFAQRLDRLCKVEVREATGGERLLPGHVLIAPGGKHITLRRSGAYYHVDVIDGPLVNRHRPSVDVLFRSAAKCAGANVLGIIMTGMGDDGARGLREMRDAGSGTVAQDEASCVVFGMPKEAIRLGGAQRVLSLMDMPRTILEWAAGSPRH